MSHPCENVVVRNLLLPLLFVLSSPLAQARAESWSLAYLLEDSRVELDVQSIVRRGPLVSWRERQLMIAPINDDDSLRRIGEIQWRKQVDCQKHQLKILSRAAFSVDDALVNYSGARPDKVIGTPFVSLSAPERKNIDALCSRAEATSGGTSL